MIKPKLYYTGGTDVVVPVGVSLSVILFLTIVAIIIMVCLMEHTLNVLKVFLNFFLQCICYKKKCKKKVYSYRSYKMYITCVFFH